MELVKEREAGDNKLETHYKEYCTEFEIVLFQKFS